MGRQYPFINNKRTIAVHASLKEYNHLKYKMNSSNKVAISMLGQKQSFFNLIPSWKNLKSIGVSSRMGGQGR